MGIDQVQGAIEATQTLLDAGHRTVWHVSGPADVFDSMDRIEGWRATLERAGAEVPPVIAGDWSAAGGYEAGKMLARIRDVTAIFAANDQTALGILRALHEHGLRVPEDVSLVGFDDLPESGVLHPAADDRSPGVRRGGSSGSSDARHPDGGPARGAPRAGAAGVRPPGERGPASGAARIGDPGVSGTCTLGWTSSASPTAIGVDFGSLSGCAVVVRVSDGAELAGASLDYPHAVLERALSDGTTPLGPDWALQVPSDYIDVLRTAVPEAVPVSRHRPGRRLGIATDFTACLRWSASRPDCTPLNELPEFAGTPHAYVKLWNTTPPSRRPTGSTHWPLCAASRGCRATAG